MRSTGAGTLPAPGWTDVYDSAGYATLDPLTQIYSPPPGVIVSATSKAAPDSYPHFIGSSFAAPYRAARNVELIKAKEKLSPNDMAAIQADVVSLQAGELASYIEAGDEHSQAVLAAMNRWNHTIAGDSA